MLVFPYIKGQQFCAAAFERGGFAGLSAVYANPPVSTAQILHPEKYFAEGREEPIAVSFPDTTYEGKKAVADNVLGEMGARLMFAEGMDEDAAEKAAAGWRGDRYLVFDGGKELVWKTIWRTPEAANAAIDALRAVCEKHFKITQGAWDHPPKYDETLVKRDRDVWLPSEKGEGRYLIIVQGNPNEVVFILAPEEKTGELQKRFAGD
jgi:hypothetical protein